MNSESKATNAKLVDKMMEGSRKALHDFDMACKYGVKENKKLLETLINDNKDTEFGKKYHFEDIHSYEDYVKNVPLSTFDDYDEYIHRMVEEGETNLITSYPIEFYAKTSGTSGVPKKVPVSDRGMNLFRNYSSSVQLAIISEHYRDTEFEDIPYGLRMMIMNFSKSMLECGVPFGSISSACLSDSTIPYMQYIMTSPKEIMFGGVGYNLKYLHARFGLEEKDVVFFTGAYIPALLDEMNYIVDNWKTLVEDIRTGTISEDLSDEIMEALKDRLKPNPERADELTKVFEAGLDDGLMKRIWPNLSAICAIWAGNFSAYARKLRRYSGSALPYYSMSYVSSEGIFGIARYPYDEKYILIPNSCFFEFIPADGVEAEIECDQPKTLTMDELEEGKEYELVITNQSGFYRYRMDDVVRVVGFYKESPAVEFKYRKKNIVSIAGEKFTEADLLFAVKEFQRRTGVSVMDFCMYADRESEPGKYIVYLEPETIVPEEKYEEYRKILIEELIRASSSLGVYVNGGSMGAPELVFLQKETFQLYRELKMYKLGINENQLKPVTILTDEQRKFFAKMTQDKEDA